MYHRPRPGLSKQNKTNIFSKMFNINQLKISEKFVVDMIPNKCNVILMKQRGHFKNACVHVCTRVPVCVCVCVRVCSLTSDPFSAALSLVSWFLSLSLWFPVLLRSAHAPLSEPGSSSEWSLSAMKNCSTKSVIRLHWGLIYCHAARDH